MTLDFYQIPNTSSYVVTLTETTHLSSVKDTFLHNITNQRSYIVIVTFQSKQYNPFPPYP